VAKRLATIVVAQRSSSALNVVSALCLEGPSRRPDGRRRPTQKI